MLGRWISQLNRVIEIGDSHLSTPFSKVVVNKRKQQSFQPRRPHLQRSALTENASTLTLPLVMPLLFVFCLSLNSKGGLRSPIRRGSANRVAKLGWGTVGGLVRILFYLIVFCRWQVCLTLALSLPDELRDGLVVKPVSLPYRRQSRALWLGSGMARVGRVSYNGTRPIIG